MTLPLAPTPRRFFAQAYSAFGILLLLELFAQFYFIAAAVFVQLPALTQSLPSDAASFDTFSALHAGNGTFLIPLTTLALLVLSFAARHSWRTTLLTTLLLLLLVLQFVLATLGFLDSHLAPIAGLHGLNALLLVVLAYHLTKTRWAL
jgi:hypothetical protein